MTSALKATKLGLRPHYKVRIVLHGAILHTASWTEPVTEANVHVEGGKLYTVKLDCINDPAYGDTLGYIDWHAVTAVSSRWSE